MTGDIASTLARMSVAVAGLGEARRIVDGLGEVLDPAPLATTLFEEPATGGWRVDAYFEAAPEEATLTQALAALAGRTLAPHVEPVPDLNWVAISQAALPPVAAGRFTVHGSHDRSRIGRRLNAIEIDAGEAFGTAHHATTLGCLLAIDRLASRWRPTPRHVLDLGCGSGVLAIAAAQVWPGAEVVASDIDPTAIAVAGGNCRANRQGRRVRTLTAPGLAHAALRRRFDLVIANILAGPLIAMAPALSGTVGRGGLAVLSGILAEQAGEVAAVYLAAGFRLVERRTLSGWTTLVLARVR